VIFGLLSWPAPLQALNMVVSPKLKLRQQHKKHNHKGGENVTVSNVMNKSTNEKNYRMHNMTISNTKNKTLKQSLKQTKRKIITNKISKCHCDIPKTRAHNNQDMEHIY
jgi:hypothetical protein